MSANDRDPALPTDDAGAATDDGATATGASAQPSVAAVELDELDDDPGVQAEAPAGNRRLLRDIEVAVTVELGRAQLRVQDVLSLRTGSVVELNRPVGAPVDLLANGRVIARGQIVVVEDQLGVRVTEFAPGGGHG